MNAQVKSTPGIEWHEGTGLWWPTDTDAETGYTYLIRRVTDVDVSVKHCRKTAVAVQAGGNIGMWPLRLAKFFSTVHTFEPSPMHFQALRNNIRSVPGIIAHEKLLSATEGEKIPFSVRKGGVSRVVQSAAEANSSFLATTIDSLKLPACDAIFLDVEGHEMEALEGARETITAYRPVITVEVWDEKRELYDLYLDELRYERVGKVHGDFIYTPRK